MNFCFAKIGSAFSVFCPSVIDLGPSATEGQWKAGRTREVLRSDAKLREGARERRASRRRCFGEPVGRRSESLRRPARDAGRRVDQDVDGLSQVGLGNLRSCDIGKVTHALLFFSLSIFQKSFYGDFWIIILIAEVYRQQRLWTLSTCIFFYVTRWGKSLQIGTLLGTKHSPQVLNLYSWLVRSGFKHLGLI